VHALLPAVTLLPRAGLVEYPSQPGAEAVDEHGPVGLTQRSRDATGLDGAPMGGPACAVGRDPGAPLGIVVARRHSRRDVGHVRVVGGELFGVAGFAGAHAAEHERPASGRSVRVVAGGVEATEPG